MKPSRFSLIPVEITLLAVFLVITGWMMLISVEVRTKPRVDSTWVLQESRTKERLRAVVEQDRATLEERIRQDRGLWFKFQILSLGSFLLLLGTVVGWARLVLRLLGGRPIVQPLGNPPPPTWGFRQIFRLLLWILVLTQLALIGQTIGFRLYRSGPVDRHLLALGNTLFLDLVAMVGAGWLLLRAGVANGNWWAKVRFAVEAYVMALPLLGLVVIGIAMVLQWLKVAPSPQAVFTIYMTESRAPVLGWMLVLITLVGPIAEELFFRGLVYGWLRARIGVVRGLGVSALLFAALHGNAVVFFPIFFLGVLFGWIYEQTGSLVAPIAVHVFHNTGMLFLAAVVKSLTAPG